MKAVSHWQHELTPAESSGWHVNCGPMGEQRLVCCRFTDCQPQAAKHNPNAHAHNKQQPTDTHTKPIFTAEPGLNQGGTEPGRFQYLLKRLQRLRYNNSCYAEDKTNNRTKRKHSAGVDATEQLISAAHTVADVCSLISSAAGRGAEPTHS